MGRKLISGLLIVTLLLGTVLPVGATDIQDAKDKEQQLEEQRDNLASEKASLSTKVKALTNSMKEAEASLKAKQKEIEEAEQELIMAKVDEREQYASMRLRMKYTYENGNIDIFQIFVEAKSIAEFITRTEYVSSMADYDREKLEEFQRTVRKVEEKELVLQAEYSEARKLQEALSEQREEAEQLLNSKSAELSEIQSDLADIRAQIKKAEEEERKRQEAEKAEKEQQAQKPQTSTKPSTQPSTKPNNSSSSSSNTSKPVVNGNGYFPHLCPGMSYQ